MSGSNINYAGPPPTKVARVHRFLAVIILVEAVLHVALRVHAGVILEGVFALVGYLAMMGCAVWILFQKSRTLEGAQLRTMVGLFALILGGSHLG